MCIHSAKWWKWSYWVFGVYHGCLLYLMTSLLQIQTPPTRNRPSEFFVAFKHWENVENIRWEARKFPHIEMQSSFPIVPPAHHLSLSDFVITAATLELRNLVSTGVKVVLWGEWAGSRDLFFNLHPPKCHIRLVQTGHNWDPKNKIHTGFLIQAAQAWGVGLGWGSECIREQKVRYLEKTECQSQIMPTPPIHTGGHTTHTPHHAHTCTKES